MGLMAYLAIFWGLSFVYHKFLSGRKRRRIKELKIFRKNLNTRIKFDSDVILEKNLVVLKTCLIDIDDTLKSVKERTAAELEKLINGLSKRVDKACPTRSNATVRETLETLVVVFGVVMGIRAIVAQPFKIPTGSMQPTLFGIHFAHTDSVDKPGPIKALFDWMNFSRRTADVVIQRDGMGVYVKDAPFKIGPISLIDNTEVGIGAETYKLPGSISSVHKISPVLYGRNGRYPTFVGRPYKAGDVLARGYHYTGDHIMVDRFSYNFIEPKRGDVFVFITDGITQDSVDAYGNVKRVPLNGRHYIKRLVGLPGDVLKISKGKLWVKEKGASDFVVVDGKFDKAFDRVYSGKGGYHGYTYGPKRMRFDGETFELKKDEYFAMGDNSANSSDGRCWSFGIVPRKNIIGRALFVWWPFSRRWGIIDSAEPEDFKSPKNYVTE